MSWPNALKAACATQKVFLISSASSPDRSRPMRFGTYWEQFQSKSFSILLKRLPRENLSLCWRRADDCWIEAGIQAPSCKDSREC